MISSDPQSHSSFSVPKKKQKAESSNKIFFFFLGASKNKVVTYRKWAKEEATLLPFLPPRPFEFMDKDFRLKSRRNQRSDATDAVDQWSGLCLFQVSFIGTSLKGPIDGTALDH